MDKETKWLRVLAIIPASAMSFMDQSILPVALPVIQQEFNADPICLQWTVNAYFLTMAMFILLGGKLADRMGHRRAFLGGMGLFAIFSAFCSLSTNVNFLIIARGLQGIGAAIMFPAQTSLIALSFPQASRGRATGIIVSIGSTFAVIGPIIGGLLTEYLSWRWIFWINLPLTLVGVLLTIALLPKSSGKTTRIDLVGFTFFALFTSLLTVLLMQAADWGWFSIRILSLALAAFLSLVFLLFRERRVSQPFLNIKLFKRPIFAAINVSIAISQFILMISVFRIIYTEQILGYSPSETGLIISVASLPVLFFSYLGGFLSDKVSPKLPIVLGFGCLVISFFWLGFSPTPSLGVYFAALLLFGMGIPLILTPSYSAAMGTVPKEQMGVAFGLIASLRMFAGTLGLALISLWISAEKSANVMKIGERAAEILSFSRTHYLLGALVMLAFIAVFFLSKRKSAHHLPEAPAEGWD
jgi:EmrB/QacA subfamily drug resistance transporter